jgi:hypothetical protein
MTIISNPVNHPIGVKRIFNKDFMDVKDAEFLRGFQKSKLTIASSKVNSDYFLLFALFTKIAG